MTKISIGSVSSGTLKTDDLLTAFADELERIEQNDEAHDEMVADARMYAKMIELGHINVEGEAAASDLVCELQDALTACAPEFMYFGANEGDGACFGWWPNIEGLEEAVRDGEVAKVAAGDQIGAPAAGGEYAGLVMEVNDHGNVTLYQVEQNPYKCTELWSCV